MRSGLLMSLAPAVSVTDGDHRGQNTVPGFGQHHDGVRKHAAIPADVAESAYRVAGRVAQPIARMAHNVKLAVGIVRQTVVAGFVVRAGAFDGAVVLGDVK